MAFGIDFGTTNTSVVYSKATQYGVTKTPHGESSQPFPSLVALHPQKPPVFGLEVKKRRSQLIAEGYQVVASFKSILGSNQAIRVGERAYSPIDVTALFLSYVRERVSRDAVEPLREAVIAIPVDFQPQQRRDLREAARRAGISVRSFVSEPTAAYVNCRDSLAGASNVAVFDWGGGTLDISLISIEGEDVSELAISGMRLGGNDIDQMLARHVHARISGREGDARAFDDLSPGERDQILERAEDAKKRLSTDEDAPIRLLRYAGRAMVRETVTLDEFSRLIASRIDEAEKLLYHTVEKAGVGLGQMDAILMVGGSCEMQSIYARMEEIGRKYRLSIRRPESIQWAVAGGAAILGELRTGYRLQQDLGVLLSDGSLYPILRAGQELPCSAPELRFGVVEDTTTASFVFADEKGNVLARRGVPIKGFTAEGIHLQCAVDDDMILQYKIFSDYAMRMAETGQINQLGFTYRIK